jgi:LysM repeat protein
MTARRKTLARLGALVASAALLAVPLAAPFSGASSHREAPLISNDPAADITDMYVFRSPDAPDTVTAVMNVWPFQFPEGGPNWYLFDPAVRYSFHITNDGDADEEIRVDFRFRTETRNPNTWLYNTGPVNNLDDETLNQRQFYSVDLVAGGQTTRLGEDLPVAPFNVGPKSFPNYERVANQAIVNIPSIPGGKVFVGPRDDPFYIDIGAAFDLLNIRRPPGNQGGGVDNLAGYNVNSLVLQVPIAAIVRPECNLGDPTDMDCVVGMWLTTSRPAQRVLRGEDAPETRGDLVQVSRLSAALVNELVVPRQFKDVFNASDPKNDERFLAVVQDPEPARNINQIFGIAVPPAPRQDIVTIFLTGIPGLNQPPDVEPAEIAHLNLAVPVNPQPNRMGLLGGDMQGYPNGRRLGDDVTDILLQASAGGTPFTPDFNVAPNNQLGDGVNQNDRPFLNTFPYLALPHSGFDHGHHGGGGGAAAPPPPAAAQPAPAPAAAAAPAAQPRTGTSGAAASGLVYTVQPGDTLSSISEAVYGDQEHVDEILAVNEEILASPEELQPGMVLTLPASAAEAEEEDE